MCHNPIFWHPHQQSKPPEQAIWTECPLTACFDLPIRKATGCCNDTGSTTHETSQAAQAEPPASLLHQTHGGLLPRYLATVGDTPCVALQHRLRPPAGHCGTDGSCCSILRAALAGPQVKLAEKTCLPYGPQPCASDFASSAGSNACVLYRRQAGHLDQPHFTLQFC